LKFVIETEGIDMRIFVNREDVEGEEDQELHEHDKIRFCLGPAGEETVYIDVFINTAGRLVIRSGDNMKILPKFGNLIEIEKA